MTGRPQTASGRPQTATGRPQTSSQWLHQPREISEFPISDRSTKSKILSFFGRRKADKDLKDPKDQTVSGRGLFDALPAITARPVSRHRPDISPPNQKARSRSVTWTTKALKGHQKSVKHQRPRALTEWNPPPLYQAMTQAVLQEMLIVPSSFGDFVSGSPRSRSGSVSSNASSSFRDSAGSSDPKWRKKDSKHEREWSASTTCSLVQKLFILVENGYILQYSSEGYPDRLPERILELGPYSVAAASDALPGRHWVLKVSQTRKEKQSPNQISKESSPRLPFRSSDTNRLVKDFLLVFESARVFDAWLTAIRKGIEEIEALEGLEHRPESRGVEGALQQNKGTRRLLTRKSVGALSYSSPHLPLDTLERPKTATKLPPSPQLPPPPRITPFVIPRKSIGSSSAGTATDLDRLRESSLSDSNSLGTTARTSIDDIPVPTSLARDSLSNDPGQKQYMSTQKAPHVPDKSMSKKSSILLAPASRSDARKSSLVDPSLLWSFEFPRTPTFQTDKLHSLLSAPSELDHSKHVISKSRSTGNMSTGQGMGPTLRLEDSLEHTPLDLDFLSTSRPVSTIAPLPSPNTLKKASSRYRRENPLALNQPLASPSEQPLRPPSSHSKSGSQDSIQHDGPKRASSYSLFPKRASSLEYGLQMPNSFPSPPLTGPVLMESMDNTANSFPFPIMGSGTTLRPNSRRSQRKNNMSIDTTHQPGEVDAREKPERSPAVTDAHMATCFGTSVPVGHVSQKASIEIPRTSSELGITTTTIEVPTGPESAYEISVPILSLPPKRDKRLSPQKSMPSLLYSSVPPLGPPPSGPLPAVPLRSPSTASPRNLRTNHLRGKSSVSSMASQSSAAVPAGRIQPRHTRGKSSVSSAASFGSSSQPSAPISPIKVKHSRKLSSVSSVGSLGSVSAWISPPGTSTVPPSPSVLGNSLTPITPTFNNATTTNTSRSVKQSGGNNMLGQAYRPRNIDITIVSPGTAF